MCCLVWARKLAAIAVCWGDEWVRRIMSDEFKSPKIMKMCHFDTCLWSKRHSCGNLTVWLVLSPLELAEILWNGAVDGRKSALVLRR
jgi:hypothetical protein